MSKMWYSLYGGGDLKVTRIASIGVYMLVLRGGVCNFGKVKDI